MDRCRGRTPQASRPCICPSLSFSWHESASRTVDSPHELARVLATAPVLITKAIIPVISVFPGGRKTEVTSSTKLKFIPQNKNVALGQRGVLSAVGVGQTFVDVQYGSTTAKISVTVSPGIVCTGDRLLPANFGRSMPRLNISEADVHGLRSVRHAIALPHVVGCYFGGTAADPRVVATHMAGNCKRGSNRKHRRYVHL